MINGFKKTWTKKIAFRYMVSKKNTKFLNLITLFSMLGVSVGVASLLIVLSVMGGFEEEMKKRLLTSDLHALIQPEGSHQDFYQGRVPLSSLSVEEIQKSAKQEGVEIESISPVLQSEFILRSDQSVKGIVLQSKEDIFKERFLKKIQEKIPEEEWKEDSVWVGQELAFEMKLFPGQKITLISPLETTGPLGKIPKMVQVKIVGIYHSGLPEEELMTVYTQKGFLESFLGIKNQANEWAVTLKDSGDVSKFQSKWNQLSSSSTGFRVKTWEDLHSQILFSMKLEQFAMSLILVFIIVVASFNIVTTLTMMVSEKKKEISILQTMGATQKDIASVFLWEGIWIGGVGVVLGLLLSFVVILVLQNASLLELPEFYVDRSIPAKFSALFYFLVSACSFGIVLFASLYPSKKAAELTPLDGIRG